MSCEPFAFFPSFMRRPRGSVKMREDGKKDLQPSLVKDDRMKKKIHWAHIEKSGRRGLPSQF